MTNLSKVQPEGTLLLTGANGGIAIGFVKQFLTSHYKTSIKGYYSVRNPSKADALRSVLAASETQGHDYEVAALDMGSFQSVRTAAQDINERVASGSLPPIRALVLNAGVQETTLNFTDDGIERTFAVNYLHQFLLVLLLLQSMDKEHGRIVVIGSTSIWTDWEMASGDW